MKTIRIKRDYTATVDGNVVMSDALNEQRFEIIPTRESIELKVGDTLRVEAHDDPEDQENSNIHVFTTVEDGKVFTLPDESYYESLADEDQPQAAKVDGAGKA